MSGLPFLLQIALRIGGLALVAVGGGNALIPALHAACVTQLNWLSDARFAESIGLSQLAPGPNMLLIPLVGWQVAGVAGAAVALVAFVLPSSTVAVLGSRYLARNAGRRPVMALVWALRPVTAGLMLCSSVVLVQTAARTLPRTSLTATAGLTLLALTVGFAALRFKCNPLVWLSAAAVLGFVW